MADVLGVVLTLLLLLANAFFVGAEFALISARRDRLEALAEQGKRSAVTVIRAGQNLSVMLAGAQLGITVCSILLGRIGEPAVANVLEKPFDLFGVPDAVLHTVSFVVAITIVVVLHVLLGEMVPKNIAMAGPESAAMLLVPPYLLWVRAVRPVIAFYDWCAHVTLRAVRVQPRTELENTVSMIELSEMIAESRSEGLLDPEEHMRLSRALQIRNRVVADVGTPLEQVRVVEIAAGTDGPTVEAIQLALGETGYSRFPVVDSTGRFVGYVHIKDVLPAVDDPPVARGTRSPAAARRADAAEAQQLAPGPGERTGRCRRRDRGAGGSGGRPGRHRARRDTPCLRFSPRPNGRDAGIGTDSASPHCWIRTSTGAVTGRRTPSSTSCSPTTDCGRVSSNVGTRDSAFTFRDRRPPGTRG